VTGNPDYNDINAHSFRAYARNCPLHRHFVYFETYIESVLWPGQQ